jgi:ABC-type uncharacterized transport system involved in gliding motility auxiliary subunit
MNANRQLIANIAGFAAVGFFGLALIYWAVIATPPLSFQSIDWPLRILVIAAIVSFTIFIIATPEAIGRAAGRRSNRLTANAVVASLVAVAIALLINVIAESVPAVRADWTASKTFTLSPQTISVLQDLDRQDRNVNAVAFLSPQVSSSPSRQEIEDLLKEYASHTGKLKYEFVDPYRSPARANQYGVTRLGAVVFDSGQKREIANGVTEADFTGALVRLFETGTKSVAFLTGHGERDPNGFDQSGYSQVKDALAKDNYQIVAADLNRSSTITATVLVIAEPKQALPEKDVQAVKSFLDGGGHVLLLLDTLMPKEALEPLQSILTKYGVTAVQGGLIDFQNSYSQQEPTLIGLSTYPDSDITRDLARDRLTTLIPLSMGLQPPTSTVEGFNVTPILQSSTGEQLSWLETDIKPDATGQIQLRYDAGKDVPGPVTIGLTVGPQDPSASTTQTQTNQVKTRLVVYGDSDFPSNVAVQQQVTNLDLFANSVSWLAGANELVSIRAKDPEAPRTIMLSAPQQSLMFFSTVVGLPLLVAIVGAVIWWRRR